MVSAVTIFGITDNCGGQRSGEHLSAKSAGMNVACTVRQFDQESGAAGFATSLVGRDRGEGGEPVGDCAIELTDTCAVTAFSAAVELVTWRSR